MIALFTIYHRPRDFPGWPYVARPWGYDGTPGPIACLSETLGALQDGLRARELFCLSRAPDDDYAIVETWL
jgi:hypothetical protein